jgi:cobalt/nickel transport system permease protein
LKKVLTVMAVLAVITGGALSWFASTHPDGLEWAIEKIHGKPEVPEKENPVSDDLSKLQEKTAVLPDYSLPSKAEEEGSPAWPVVDPGTSLSGILGGIMVLGLVLIFGFAIKLARKIKAKS